MHNIYGKAQEFFSSGVSAIWLHVYWIGKNRRIEKWDTRYIPTFYCLTIDIYLLFICKVNICVNKVLKLQYTMCTWPFLTGLGDIFENLQLSENSYWKHFTILFLRDAKLVYAHYSKPLGKIVLYLTEKTELDQQSKLTWTTVSSQ